jgi:hypothetical protein
MLNYDNSRFKVLVYMVESIAEIPSGDKEEAVINKEI